MGITLEIEVEICKCIQEIKISMQLIITKIIKTIIY
jgi:hypothetical protein